MKETKNYTPRVLRLGLPKGSLQEPAFALMAKAGFVVNVSSRSYVPRINDPEIKTRLIRAQHPQHK